MTDINNNSKVYREVISIYLSGNKNPANISMLTCLPFDLVSAIINDFVMKRKSTDPLIPSIDDSHILKSEIVDEEFNPYSPDNGYPDQSFRSLLFDDNEMASTIDPSRKL
jgi:hypothetical protein